MSTVTTKRTSSYATVGLFVALGLTVATLLVLILGSERNSFSRKVTLHTSFADVGGLRVGSPVRMGGITIGSVTAVRFDTNRPGDPNVHVDFEVTADSLQRIRRNSVARIGSKGLLGDKALDISIGDPAQPALRDGESLQGDGADQFSGLLARAESIARRADELMGRVDTATRPLANEQLARDLLGILRNVESITSQVATANGTVGRLLRDEQLAGDVQATVNSARQTMGELRTASAQLSALARDARTGNGLVHALVYDPQGANAVRELGRAAGELATITRDVRTGNGGLHNIIYGNESSQLVANLNESSQIVRDVLRGLQNGRGTLGALLVDPSLYDDIRGLVGNVQRNEILRAMVRYSIQAGERDAQGAIRAAPAPAGGGTR